MKRTWTARLAFKNLLRYKRRTLITAGAIAFGLMMYLVVDSILEAAAEESIRNLRRYETADMMAAVPGFLDERDTLPLDLSFPWRNTAGFLEASGVKVAPRIQFGADIVFFQNPFPEDGNVPLRIFALDPAADSDVFHIRETLVEGRWLNPGAEEAVIGRWLAEDIGAVPGASVIAVTETLDGYAQTIDLEIVGILDVPDPVINREGFFISLDVADYYLEMDGAVNSLYLTWPGAGIGRPMPESAAADVKKAGLELYPWEVQASDYVDVMSAEHETSGMIVFLILIIAAVGISNTMLMAVYERKREVGMMRALGMKDSQVRALFLWESAGIGLVGSILGMLVAALLNVPLVKNGWDLSSMMRDMNVGYRSSGVFYGTWHFQGFLNAMLLGVGLSVAVAALSLHRILRTGITDSLRFD